MTDDYLFEPDEQPSADVQQIERLLAPFAYPITDRPLRLPAATSPLRVRVRRTVAIAAVIVLLAAGASAYWTWRWTWPSGAPWPIRVTSENTSRATEASLSVARPFTVAATASADVGIARIGSMRVGAGTTLQLAETDSTRHRVILERGSVRVRVWAPPGRLSFQTPAGAVVDLGCVFDLSVDAARVSRVRVRTGWVQMSNAWGESLVPAGASSRMRAAARPGVPVYDDAVPEFAAAVRRFENGRDGSAIERLNAALPLARPHDVLTLLMLGRIAGPDLSRPLFERAAALVPPPPHVSLAAVIDGNRDQLWEWYAALDLPPAKSWWRNWRDALPRLGWK